MSSTYSQDLRIQLMGAGDQAGTWGSTTNNNFQYILEQAIAGWQQVSITSANQVLTYLNGATSTASLNQSIYAMLQLSGATLNFNVFTPNGSSKTYIINNNTSYTATIAVSSSGSSTTPAGSTVAIPALSTATVYTDGTNFYPQNSYLPGTPTAPTATTGTNTTQIATTAFVNASVNNVNSVLTGSIQMWATTSAPSGYLLCNGQSVSTTTFSALFAVIGYTFGGSGGNFNVPNYTDRFPVGAGSSYSLASTGGSTTISTSNLPAHNHTLGSASISGTVSTTIAGSGDLPHTHGYTTYGAFASQSGSSTPCWYGTSSATTGNNNQSLNHSHSASSSFSGSISGSTDNTGGAAAFLPPYLGIYFIIKT